MIRSMPKKRSLSDVRKPRSVLQPLLRALAQQPPPHAVLGVHRRSLPSSLCPNRVPPLVFSHYPSRVGVISDGLFGYLAGTCLLPQGYCLCLSSQVSVSWLPRPRRRPRPSATPSLAPLRVVARAEVSEDHPRVSFSSPADTIYRTSSEG